MNAFLRGVFYNETASSSSSADVPGPAGHFGNHYAACDGDDCYGVGDGAVGGLLVCMSIVQGLCGPTKNCNTGKMQALLQKVQGLCGLTSNRYL